MGQAVMYYRDPFKLVPVSQLAEIADKFRRNEILTSNEIRAEIGFKPSKEERADELSNPNLNKSNEELGKDGKSVLNEPLAKDSLQQIMKKNGGNANAKI